jgi:glucuronokinase
MSYTTNIPRHSGLAGSSAIITAAFNCLLEWFEVQDSFKVQERPTFVLNVEKQELGIMAGLMDRVVQARAAQPCLQQTQGSGLHVVLNCVAS